MNPETEYREGLDDLVSHYKSIISLLGEDTGREGLQKTPMRVAKAMQILTRGYSQDAHKVLLDALFEEKYSQMVIVKDIDFFSPPPSSAGTHDPANKGLHTGNAETARCHGGCRGETHVHADARSGEAERHNDDERLLGSFQPGQDTRGVYEPFARRKQADIMLE